MIEPRAAILLVLFVTAQYKDPSSFAVQRHGIKIEIQVIPGRVMSIDIRIGDGSDKGKHDVEWEGQNRQ